MSNLTALDDLRPLFARLHQWGVADWVRRKQAAEMLFVADDCVKALDTIQQLQRLLQECETERDLNAEAVKQLTLDLKQANGNASEVIRLQTRENEVAKIVARALACVNYQQEHGEWLADAAKWLNGRVP